MKPPLSLAADLKARLRARGIPEVGPVDDPEFLETLAELQHERQATLREIRSSFNVLQVQESAARDVDYLVAAVVLLCDVIEGVIAVDRAPTATERATLVPFLARTRQYVEQRRVLWNEGAESPAGAH